MPAASRARVPLVVGGLFLALVLIGCPSPPPPSVACIDFEGQPLGTQYGGPAGHTSGDVVFTANGIAVAVVDFVFVGGGGTFNVATIDTAMGTDQDMGTNNINLAFDFTQLQFEPAKVTLDFLDLGGFENVAVNGSTVFAGELSAAPATVGGATVTVTTTPVPGGVSGTLELTGAIEMVQVGGQEFWLDDVCASR